MKLSLLKQTTIVLHFVIFKKTSMTNIGVYVDENTLYGITLMCSEILLLKFSYLMSLKAAFIRYLQLIGDYFDLNAFQIIYIILLILTF